MKLKARTTVSKEYAQGIIQSMGSSLIVVNPDGNIRTVNQATLDLLGYEEKEMIGQPVGTIIAAAAAAAAAAAEYIPFAGTGLKKLFALGSIRDLDVIYRPKTGQGIPVSFNGSVLRDKDGKLVAIVCVGKDMRETRRRLEELNEARALSENIIRSTVDAIIILDWDGKIKIVNQATLRLLGYESEKDLLGGTIDMFAGNNNEEEEKEDGRLFICTGLKKLIDEGSIRNHEVNFRTKDDMFIPVLLSGTMMRDEQGRLLGTALIAKDIRDVKELVRLKNEFVSTVSHELRTPLTIIKASVENMTDGIMGQLSEKQAHVCEMIARNIHRLEQLINNLLDLSRLESGVRMKRQRINLAVFVGDNFHDLSAEAAARGCELEVNIQPDIPDIAGDRLMITEVLTNLVSNAVRFARTRVIVEARACTDVDIFGGTTDFVKISVTDDGPGIAAGDLPRLFHKFEQLNRPEGGTGYMGTGLGLVICKDIVENYHHGKIWAESDLGRGSKFCCLLPCWKEERKDQLGESI